MTGFYGKLPAKGDFLSRNLPRAFTDMWDDWLQTGMHESRQALGEDWLEIYLTSPLWRFILPSGLCNESSWAGVVMPSMDRVGRYFPMTVVTPLTTPVSPVIAAAGTQAWFEAVENCLLEALDDESLDLEAFDQTLQGLLMEADNPSPLDLTTGLDDGIRISLGDDLSIARTLLGLSASSVEQSLGSHSVWWGQGSERIAPSLVLCRGLPGPGRFTALLDGNWDQHGWRDPQAQAVDVDSIIAGIGVP